MELVVPPERNLLPLHRIRWKLQAQIGLFQNVLYRLGTPAAFAPFHLIGSDFGFNNLSRAIHRVKHAATPADLW